MLRNLTETHTETQGTIWRHTDVCPLNCPWKPNPPGGKQAHTRTHAHGRTGSHKHDAQDPRIRVQGGRGVTP